MDAWEAIKGEEDQAGAAAALQRAAAKGRIPPVEWSRFQHAARGGSVTAMVNLAWLYQSSPPPQRNYALALSWYRRAAAKLILYPNYRLAHEAIDSLRAIGTDEAVTALEEILALRAMWSTKKFQAMKFHALRSISKIRGERSEEVLERARRSADRSLRVEAERILARRVT